jgi:hypothetical protein
MPLSDAAECTEYARTAVDCFDHVHCSLINSCNNILGTWCGWCVDSGVGMSGTLLGPSEGACLNWVYFALSCPSTQHPQQIHIAYGAELTEIVVSWSSLLKGQSRVTVTERTDSALRSSRVYVGQPVGLSHNNWFGLHYFHKVNVTDLHPGSTYDYTVSNDAATSKVHTFTAPRADTDYVAKFLVFGDMGRFGGAAALHAMIQEADHDATIMAAIHIGDLAYDLDLAMGLNGDAFMERISPIAARLPYMVATGNHEPEWDNKFSHYRHRFAMPNSWQNDGYDMWYSFDVQLIHFVCFSTEHLFSSAKMMQLQPSQLEWLEKDLIQADRNRQTRPWIVAFGHRPFYCSNDGTDECVRADNPVRLQFEQLFL